MYVNYSGYFLPFYTYTLQHENFVDTDVLKVNRKKNRYECAFCVRYDVDETNLEETLAEKLFEEEPTYSYEILSKKTGPKRKPLTTQQQPHTGKHGGCCC